MSLRENVEAFLVTEGMLADGPDYDAWLALWDEDGRYEVPTSQAEHDAFSPAIIRDGYDELTDRIARLKSGLVHSQTPVSQTSRVTGRAVISTGDDKLVSAVAPFVLVESRPTGLTHWGGRYEYRLRPRDGDGFGIALKRVFLVNRDEYLPPLTFLV